ncbi:TRAP transporter small permease [Blautia schinkii]|nr:TRAP transporter small permease [Blautia schinkii]
MKKLYYGLNKISNAICRILTILIVGIVIINAGSVFLQVLNRYIIVKISDFSFPWTEELARYSMIWLCYLALPIVYREGSMAQLDLVFDRLGKKGKMVLYILTRILCLVFIAVAVYYGIYIVQTRMMFKSSILRAPGYTLYSAPIFGCVVMTYEIITEMIGVFSGVLEPFYAGGKRQYPEPEEGGESR